MAGEQLTDVVQLAVSEIATGELTEEEPSAKRMRRMEIVMPETQSEISREESSSIKSILFNMNKAICLRLEGIENKVEGLSNRTKVLEDKVDGIVQTVKELGNRPSVTTPTTSRKQHHTPRRQSTIVIGLPANSGNQSQSQDQSLSTHSTDNEDDVPTPIPTRLQENGTEEIDDVCLTAGGTVAVTDSKMKDESGEVEEEQGRSTGQRFGPNVQFITLNSEDDYPGGTWLGDENNIEMRVRCPITPSDLLHIHQTCRTAERMALILLDYLFDRETQAMSNISGMGRHGKKQLDPLMIYGIRCHLISKFAITDADWHRIKQNIDSKCRTSFRRRQRGQPLTVKAFARKLPSNMHTVYAQELHTVHPETQADQLSQLAVNQGDMEVHIQGTAIQPGDTVAVTQGNQVHHLHITQADGHHVTVADGTQVHHVQITQTADGQQVAVLQPGEEVTIQQVAMQPGAMSIDSQPTALHGMETTEIHIQEGQIQQIQQPDEVQIQEIEGQEVSMPQ
ncbi:protein BANP-like isoform X2 [Branchiostoma floridae x Branchiostoma belcheri]